MRAYVIVINGEVQSDVPTSLKQACEDAGVSYSSAANGNREWLKRNPKQQIEIVQVSVNLIKGRGKNSLKIKS